MKRTVIVSSEIGIFLGSAAGLGFWSMLDCAGQYNAVVFDNEADARDYVSKWETPTDPNQFRYVEVESASGEYANVMELNAAGLHDLTEHMFLCMPIEGQA